MSGTLLVDDKDSFVDFLEQQAEAWQLHDVMFCRELDGAYDRFNAARPRRIIADNTFEGSHENGLTFLERVRREDEAVELILLTGNEPTKQIQKRLRAIRGRLITKADVDADLMETLLSGKPLPVETSTEPDLDVAELKLRLEEARHKLKWVSETNAMLVRDIIQELIEADRNGEAGIIIDNRLYTPSDLVEEILAHTDVGKQLVEYHHKMFHLLRGGK
jgi:ActR/RegA family two-component response regulator